MLPEKQSGAWQTEHYGAHHNWNISRMEFEKVPDGDQFSGYSFLDISSFYSESVKAYGVVTLVWLLTLPGQWLYRTGANRKYTLKSLTLNVASCWQRFGQTWEVYVKVSRKSIQ